MFVTMLMFPMKNYNYRKSQYTLISLCFDNRVGSYGITYLLKILLSYIGLHMFIYYFIYQNNLIYAFIMNFRVLEECNGGDCEVLSPTSWD